MRRSQPERLSMACHAGARVAHVLELKPDICSLDVGTMNFGSFGFINVPNHVSAWPRRSVRPA